MLYLNVLCHMYRFFAYMVQHDPPNRSKNPPSPGQCFSSKADPGWWKFRYPPKWWNVGENEMTNYHQFFWFSHDWFTLFCFLYVFGWVSTFCRLFNFRCSIGRRYFWMGNYPHRAWRVQVEVSLAWKNNNFLGGLICSLPLKDGDAPWMVIAN